MSDRLSTTSEPEDRLGMTGEQWVWFQAYTHGFGEQDESGVDVASLRENLRLTPSQRVEKLLRTIAPNRVKELSPDQSSLRDVVVSLRSHNVRCVVIGGWAMHCHGIHWHGCDLDLCYARDVENLTALVNALVPFHPRLRGAPAGLPFQWEIRTLRSGESFFLVTDAEYVDLFEIVPGVDSFQILWEQSQQMELFGVPIRVASLDHLIAMRRAAGRPKDHAYLAELEKLRARALRRASEQKERG